jgi:hypothetical protein
MMFKKMIAVSCFTAIASTALAGQSPVMTSTSLTATATPISAAQPIPEFSVLAHPLYVGLITGYGNTNWDRLVEEDSAAAIATPNSAEGEGVLIGGLVGYDITQYIGVEAQYIRFPDASVNFLGSSDGVPNPYGLTHMTSMTDYASMIAKASVPFDNNRFSGFTEIGYAVEMVSDPLGNRHDFRPTFGFGMSYFWLPHWTLTSAFNYTAGTGVANEETASGYIPYLYSFQLIAAYRI